MATTTGGVFQGPEKAGYTRDRTWRTASIGPGFYTFGVLLWLIGSCLMAGAQERFRFIIIPGPTLTSLPTFGSAAVTSGGLYTAACVLWIIASCFWILGSLGMLMSAFAQSALVTVDGRRPGLATMAITAAWFSLVATIILLIGSAIMVGGGLDNAGAGAILLLIGFTIWGIAIVWKFTISFTVSTMAVAMPNIPQRHFGWGSSTSLLLISVGMILFFVASVSLVARDPPGLMLTGSIVYIIGSCYMLFGTIQLWRAAHSWFVPTWGFATTPEGVATPMKGAALGTAAGVGAGALGAKAAAAPSAAPATAARSAEPVAQPAI